MVELSGHYPHRGLLVVLFSPYFVSSSMTSLWIKIFDSVLDVLWIGLHKRADIKNQPRLLKGQMSLFLRSTLVPIRPLLVEAS